MNIQLRHFVPVCSCIIRVTAPPSCWVKLMLSATKSVIVTLCAGFYPRPSPPSLVTQYSELNTGLLTHQISECQMNKSFQISLSSVHSSSSSSINVSLWLSGYLFWWEAETTGPRGSGHNLNKQSDQSKTADGQMSFAVFPEVGGQVLDKWRTLDW